MDIFHTTEFEKALKIFKSNPGAIFKIILLDIIFLLVYGFVKGSPDLSGFLGKIYEYLKIFLTLTSQKAKDLTLEVARQVSIFSLIDENPLIAKYFYLLLLAFLLFGLVTYFLYSFMQGSSWYLNAKLTSETPSYKNYIKQFFKVNILWFLLYVIFIIVGFINSFRFTILERSGTPNPPGLDIFIIVLIIIIAYFGSISYALIGQRKQIIKQAFSIGVKHVKDIFPAFALTVLLFATLNYILIFLNNFSQGIMLLIGVITIFPLIVWARAYLFLIVGKITSNG